MSDLTQPARDWLAVDWSKSNAEIARELGVVRGTVHSQRKRYAPDTIPGRKQITRAEREAALRARATPPPTPANRVPALHADSSQAAADVISITPPGPMHWSKAADAPRRLPRGVDALDGMHFALGPYLTTPRALLEALGEDEDWAIGIADRISIPWSPEFSVFLNTLTHLGLLEQRLVFHPEVMGGVFVQAFRRRRGEAGVAGRVG